MGCSCSYLSSSDQDEGGTIRPLTAMVVDTSGSLHEYAAGAFAGDALATSEQPQVLCSSDRLYFDAFPPPVSPDERLVPGQIYFLLPTEELSRRLTGDKAAALVNRASTAMKRAAEAHGRRRKIRVVPVAAEVGGLSRMRSKEWGSVLSTVEEADEFSAEKLTLSLLG